MPLHSADYDKAGRLTTWADGDYQKTLTYDQNSLITAMHSKQNDKEKNEQLSYNAYGELTRVTDTDSNQATQYQYDLNANRLGFSSPKSQADYEYKKGTDQLLNITATTNDNEQTSSYRYDAAGNPTLISVQQGQDGKARTQRQFTYGARGQLTQIIDDNQTTDYRYNHAMQRVSKTIANDEQRYLWQQGLLDAEIEVNDNQETLTRRYIYIGLRPIAMIDYDVDNNASIYTVHTDHLGTPQQLSDSKQQTVWQGEYDAFGQVTVKAVSNNNTQDMQAKRKGWLPSLMNSANATQSITNEPFEFNLRFAGQYEDSESGYYYNWHRYYNPETGRYLTSDPIGLNGGLNTYGYAGQNPVSFVDPWGLFTIFIGGAGDHEPFVGLSQVGVIGPTEIIKDIKDEFRKQVIVPRIKQNTGIDTNNVETLSNTQAHYYGYNETDKAFNKAKLFLSANPTSTVNIVGHSLGGWQAAHLAQQLNEVRCGAVDNLITLDPVGTRYRIINPVGGIKFKYPKPTAKTWTNIRAEAETTSINDVIANIGGQWNPSSENPTYNYTLALDHAFAYSMLTAKIRNESGESADSPWDLLVKHYANLPTDYTFENAPQ